jgi:peptidoglycan/LPS O-acetylase OafA/YrhL
MKYRPDIDGLRALAIVAVILFHYYTRRVPAGFLGVDVFFVISGFLITKIVANEIAAGTFSLQRFYERRIRRIFPAIYAVMAALLVAGYFLFLPGEFEDLGKSIIATTLFVSNFYFYRGDTYFGPVSAHEPLLHTWSLAVEEQFYLVFPIALLLLARAGKRAVVPVLCLAAVASVVFNAWQLGQDPAAAFYLPLSRAWELLIGALLALDVVPAIASRPLREALGACGLAVVGAGMAFAPAGGYGFLPPAVPACLGTACMIVAGSNGGSFVSRALGWRLPVYVGKISYSLYVWHWPILIAYSLADGPASPAKLGPLVLTFVVGALSERFIERPFRKPRKAREPGTAARVIRFGGAAMFGSLVLASIPALGGGLAWRYPSEVDRLAAYAQYGVPQEYRAGTCFLEPLTTAGAFAHFASKTCLREDPARKNYLLIGDSHAAAIWGGLAKVYDHINFMQANVSACVPVLDQPRDFSQPQASTCHDMMEFIFRSYLPKHKLDGVILCGRWQATDVPALMRTLRYLRGFERNIIVIGPIVEYTDQLPRVLALSVLHRDPGLVARERKSEVAALDLEMERALEGTGVRYISMYQTICVASACRTTTDDGVPLQFDYGHLTADGARWVALKWKTEGAL